ncbi:hypothetical protein GE21DRAFT_7611 [Neurospora crassa]|uniref:Uncharacterized protein n=2 Tax=Neurospora crassa TaxID=5141 RepID=Q1K846_NEUCR|nr:hypothetical protein NCU01191 [Neurospora crassa OR74A]EAA32321.1 hypothetical protein NCU01191 [Neurospora crassa OR74A]KHE87751.1 hypothetical protein GE21DRAFT_7611 [Neurospora crassa]CAD21390.1 hypothetical protein [Neurospora crassa]|eukprot:XP_961557.1 hypothetical protein NCU01191 [Neurospora crassa OR74A]
MADRRPGPNFKPAAPSRIAPPSHTGLSSAGAGAGAGARVGASVRRNLFQQQPQSQPAQASRQPTAAPDSTQSQGHFPSQQSFQSQTSQTSHSQIHQSNFQSHLPHQQASYLTQPPSSYSDYSYPYPQDLLSQQYQQPVPQHHEEDTKMTSSQESPPLTDALTDPNLEIVVRDKETGEIDLGHDPPTPPYDEEMETIMEARIEQEKERERLADAVREWLTEHEAEGRGDVGPEGAGGGGGGGEGAGGGGGGGMDTEDLLEAVKASLKAKVAALSEDNWMFEREEVLHLH